MALLDIGPLNVCFEAYLSIGYLLDLVFQEPNTLSVCATFLCLDKVNREFDFTLDCVNYKEAVKK